MWPVEINPRFTRSALPIEYLPLLISILESTESTHFKDYPIIRPSQTESKKKFDYEVNMFIDFLKTLPPLDFDNFQRLMGDVGLPWEKWANFRLDGIPNGEDYNAKQRAEIALCASAQILERPLKYRLAEYVAYCKRHVSIDDIRSFQRHKKEINNLLKECGYRPPKNTHRFDLEIKSRLREDSYYREAVRNKVLDFIANNDRGYVTIEGDAGTGKSWLMAYLTEYFFERQDQYTCAWHFNNHAGDNSSRACILNLYSFLKQDYELEKFEEEYQRIESDQTFPLHSFLSNILAALSLSSAFSDYPLVILIDALDEVSETDPSKMMRTTNILYLPKSPPKGVFIIISSRFFTHQSYYKSKTPTISLSPDREYQKKDIEGYIWQKLAESRVTNWISEQNWEGVEAPQNQFVSLLCKKSGYLFIFLFYVFQEIERFDLEENAIPDGLDEYYADQYFRLLGPDKSQHSNARKILDAIFCSLNHKSLFETLRAIPV